MVQVTAGGSSASSIRDRGPVGSQCLTGVWMTVAQFPDSIPVVELEARRGAVTVSCPLAVEETIAPERGQLTVLLGPVAGTPVGSQWSRVLLPLRVQSVAHALHNTLGPNPLK